MYPLLCLGETDVSNWDYRLQFKGIQEYEIILWNCNNGIQLKCFCFQNLAAAEMFF